MSIRCNDWQVRRVSTSVRYSTYYSGKVFSLLKGKLIFYHKIVNNQTVKYIKIPVGGIVIYTLIIRATQNRGLLIGVYRGLLSQIGGNSGVIILRKKNIFTKFVVIYSNINETLIIIQFIIFFLNMDMKSLQLTGKNIFVLHI